MQLREVIEVGALLHRTSTPHYDKTTPWLGTSRSDRWKRIQPLRASARDRTRSRGKSPAGCRMCSPFRTGRVWVWHRGHGGKPDGSPTARRITLLARTEGARQDCED